MSSQTTVIFRGRAKEAQQQEFFVLFAEESPFVEAATNSVGFQLFKDPSVYEPVMLNGTGTTLAIDRF
jgi:hypothetical protein